MPANNTVKRGLSLIDKDKSKVLGLTLGQKSLSTGDFVPRAGQHHSELPLPLPH